ncbi:MAG: class I SAM-dependent methyltransferase [Spongiibacteraceae bacterium]|jgi:16S rRNA (guanine1516-N2)-methyltransferase|nr:class I SAM-dependent methyltransferase [Spongiibacteraceae bacterium]
MTRVAVVADMTPDPRAEALAERLQLPLIATGAPDYSLLLSYRDDVLSLEPADGSSGSIAVDFSGGASRHRLQGGAELVVRAVRGRSREPLRVVDATAGLGRDSLVLAHAGFDVTLIERSPIVAALLEDGLQRARQARDPAINAAATRMQLLQGDACRLLAQWRATRPDVIYLDPMFPDERKSALPKKEMRLFQQLLGPGNDTELLAVARTVATRRVVVKRPLKGPALSERAPSYVLSGKAVRFDVYAVNTD